MKEFTRIAFPLPVEAHKKVKILCVQKGWTLSELVIHALEHSYKELEGAMPPARSK